MEAYKNLTKLMKIVGVIDIALIFIIIIIFIITEIIYHSSSSNNYYSYGSRMTPQEIEFYNSHVTIVEDNSTITGSQARAIIEKVKSSNSGNMNDSKKFIAIEFEVIENHEKIFNGYKSTEEYNNNYYINPGAKSGIIGHPAQENNDAKYVKSAAADMTVLEEIIKDENIYSIKYDYNDGLVCKVTIKEINNINN